jgi:UTP:GlnB (protein PII) uridylyltransferase
MRGTTQFSNFKTTDPQRFYLNFKNCVVPLINTEIKRLEKSLTHTSDSHLLLLKISTLVDAIIQAAFDASIWLHNHTLQKKLHPKNIPIAIIARGGYGREEIYFQSNIDVQIILGQGQTEEIRQIVKHLEYLFVHQNIFQTSTSTCYANTDSLGRELGEGKITDLLSLPSRRLITGNPDTYLEAINIVKKVSALQKENLLNYCHEHKNYYEVSNTVFQQEPNVKEELNRLYWALALARLKYNLKNTNQFDLLDELLKKDLISAPAFKSIQSSLAFLSKVRLFLHCDQKGSYRDMMSYEVRGK